MPGVVRGDARVCSPSRYPALEELMAAEKKTVELQVGVSLRMVVRTSEPAPMAMAICAERRKIRIENSGRAKSARPAMLTANAATPMKQNAITNVPQ